MTVVLIEKDLEFVTLMKLCCIIRFKTATKHLLSLNIAQDQQSYHQIDNPLIQNC